VKLVAILQFQFCSSQPELLSQNKSPKSVWNPLLSKSFSKSNNNCIWELVCSTIFQTIEQSHPVFTTEVQRTQSLSEIYYL